MCLCVRERGGGRRGGEGGREEGRKGGREGGREIEIEMICCVGRSSVHTIRTVSTSAIHSGGGCLLSLRAFLFLVSSRCMSYIPDDLALLSTLSGCGGMVFLCFDYTLTCLNLDYVHTVRILKEFYYCCVSCTTVLSYYMVNVV